MINKQKLIESITKSFETLLDCSSSTYPATLTEGNHLKVARFVADEILKSKVEESESELEDKVINLQNQIILAKNALND